MAEAHPARILIVDDEPSSLELLEVYLRDKGHDVACAMTGLECLERVASFRPAVLVLDVRLPDRDGLDILSQLKASGAMPHVIIVTAFHDMATTIKAMKLGAFEYIPKPIDVDELEAAIERALDLSRTKAGGLVIGGTGGFAEGEIIGKTREMKEIFKTISILSGNKVTVLIEGETGTGKELVARAIHSNSQDRDKPFIAINCSAIVENLLESELFGHEKGAFTGAVSAKKGKFEIAGDGAILLDEVGEIPYELQAKLLRFLQEREFQRVGGERALKSGARIIAATNRDLYLMVREGTFREDLYYRLSVATIKIPPLRDRKPDIPFIAEYLLRKINAHLKKSIRGVEEKAMVRMAAHDWPGNVREMENVLTRAAMYTQGDIIFDTTIAPLLERQQAEQVQGGSKQVSDAAETEKDRILRVLQETQWHYGNASKALGISRPTLNKRLRALGIPPRSRRI